MGSQRLGLGAANQPQLEGAKAQGVLLADVQPGLQALISGVGLNGEAAGAGPEGEAAADGELVVVADHFHASAELGLGVVGGAGGLALGLEISDAVAAVLEADHEVSGAGHVAAQAVGHHLSTHHRDAIPQLVGQQRGDPVGVVRRVRRLQASGWIGVPPLVDHHLQGPVRQVAPWLPDVFGRHDRLHLLRGLGHG